MCPLGAGSESTLRQRKVEVELIESVKGSLARVSKDSFRN